MIVAIITNPASRFNRAHRNALSRTLGERGRWRNVEVDDRERLCPVLADVLESRPDLLVINGGDGTVQGVMTALLQHRPVSELPMLAILPGGTTNMTARDVNGPVSFRRALAGLVSVAESGAGTRPIRQRAMLCTSGDDRQVQAGFFFGVGAVIGGIEYCHNQVYASGVTGSAAPGLALLRAAIGIARREPRFAGGTPLSFETPHGSGEMVASMLVASTLHRLFLGIEPFWGSENGPLRYTLIRARPYRFLSGLPRLLRGRPGRHLTPEHGYSSHAVDSMRLQATGRYTIDGEFFPMPAAGLTLGTTEPLRFLSLGNGSPPQ